MAGNGRFELTSASPDLSFPGNYAQRGAYSGPSLDRSGSFREGSDGRVFSSGKGTLRGSGTSTGDVSSLSQCLMLEPIVMGDQKCMLSGELRRVLGFSGGSTSEDNSFGATHLRNSPPVAIEELKRFRATVADTCIRASGRAKKLDKHMHKLSKYFEATTSKKQQRNELLTNERSGSSSLKMGNQMHRSSSDLVHQKLEDRSKNVMLNKRVRTSVAETRAEVRSNGLPRQPLMMSKERDMVRDSNMDSDIVEEKIRRLPAGGESWDKKMKRKRSVGAVSARPIDSDGEPKRTVHHKLTSEPGLQSSDSQSYRSGAPNVTGSVNKLDGTFSLASSNARATTKVEQDKSTLLRDVTAGLSKERNLAKGNLKLSNRDDTHVICPSPIAKGKASRAPRSGPSMATNSVSNIPRVSGTLDSWELSHSTNKNSSITGANNRKRAMPSGSSSPPITQWGGQRPQKISRTRRANLVSPVSNHDELQTPAEGCSSDFGSRLTSSGTNISLLSKGSALGAQNFKAKPENVSSPARFSESEESGAGENRFKEKGAGSGELEEKAVNAAQSVGTPPMLLKKNKFLVKEDDGIRRQGRSGRGSVSRASMSPVGEKLDSAPTTKPLRSMRPGSDKNGSKSGRPLKKASDRKGYSRLGHAISAGSPDFTGESDDDREELLQSANHAYNSSVLACSSAFWKKVDGLFASISSEGKSYLAQQLKLALELHESLSQTLGSGSANQGDCLHDEISLSDALSGERSRSTQNKSESRDLCNTDDSVDQYQCSTLSGGLDSGRQFDHVTPLYQRVLSALIIEDDIEEFDENGWARCMSPQNAVVASPDDACFVDAESKHRDRMEFECESIYGVQTQSNGHANRLFPHHTSSNYGRKSRVLDSPCDDELSRQDNGYANSEVQVLVGLSGCDLDGAQSRRSSSTECQYEQMCLEDKLLLELHSIGLYPETVPDLHDKEDEVINQEIIQLNNGLYQQVSKKKSCLDKIYEAIQGGQDVEGQDLELVAMNKLVEMAYKKLLATRGSLASKNGMPKVSKQVALAFARRTLARCKKFEDCGVSCFNEPAFRDIIFAPPPRICEAMPLTGGGLADTSRNSVGGDTFDTYSHQSDQAFAKNGPILNRGKKKEVLLDDVGGSSIRTTSLGSTLLGGTKGKRSERDSNRDVSVQSNITKAGRSSLGISKGERKTKTKPKQKTAQLSTSGNGFMNKFMETSNQVYPSPAGGSGEPMNNSGNRKREVGLIFPGNTAPDSVKEMKESLDFSNMPLNDIDLPIEELGVGSDIGGNQDFTSWFNFEDDGLQDHDAVGLDIPMDDLADLMF